MSKEQSLGGLVLWRIEMDWQKLAEWADVLWIYYIDFSLCDLQLVFDDDALDMCVFKAYIIV